MMGRPRSRRGAPRMLGPGRRTPDPAIRQARSREPGACILVGCAGQQLHQPNDLGRGTSGSSRMVVGPGVKELGRGCWEPGGGAHRTPPASSMIVSIYCNVYEHARGQRGSSGASSCGGAADAIAPKDARGRSIAAKMMLDRHAPLPRIEDPYVGEPGDRLLRSTGCLGGLNSGMPLGFSYPWVGATSIPQGQLVWYMVIVINSVTAGHRVGIRACAQTGAMTALGEADGGTVGRGAAAVAHQGPGAA
jgi:hypothetical protein